MVSTPILLEIDVALDSRLFTHFDEAAITTLYELLGEDYKVLLTTYLDDSEKHVKKLAQLIDNHDGEGLTRAAHALKGISANVGVLKFSDLCKHMEFSARDNDLDGCKATLPALQEEYNAINQLIRECL